MWRLLDDSKDKVLNHGLAQVPGPVLSHGLRGPAEDLAPKLLLPSITSLTRTQITLSAGEPCVLGRADRTRAEGAASDPRQCTQPRNVPLRAILLQHRVVQEGKVELSANLGFHPTCSYRAEARTPPSSQGARLFPQHRRRGLLASLPNLAQLQHNYCQRQALAAQPRGFPASNSNCALKQEDGEIR